MGFFQATRGKFRQKRGKTRSINETQYLEDNMKRVLFVLLCVMLALSVQSCSDEVESATLRVEMDKSVRTLSPSRENMEINGYRVVAVGPDGKERAPRYTYYS